MQSNWAEENLQIIRTLMERSAVYRRALAPIMIAIGLLGVLAALAAWWFKIISIATFVFYWTVVSSIALCLAFVLARRQAIKDKEPFWSGPTRRVAQALLPGLVTGVAFGVLAFSGRGLALQLWPAVCSILALVWVMLYGCATHAAGFFTPPGMKWLGWIFILGAPGLYALFAVTKTVFPDWFPNFVMEFFFGVLQLAYGIHIYVSKTRQNPV